MSFMHFYIPLSLTSRNQTGVINKLPVCYFEFFLLAPEFNSQNEKLKKQIVIRNSEIRFRLVRVRYYEIESFVNR